jgi:DNA polymerase-3 subunit gamma/tau
LRNLLVCKDAATLQLLEVGQNIREKYKIQSALVDVPALLRALAIVNRADVQYKSSRNPRLLVELTLMQLCSLKTAESEKKNDSSIKASFINAGTAVTPLPSNPVSSATNPVAPAAPPTEKTAAATAEKPVGQVPESNPQPTPLPSPAKRPLMKTGSPSIQAFIKPEQKAGVTDPAADVTKELPRNAFTSEQLERCWTQYATIQKENNKPNYAVTLSAKKLLLKDTTLIEFMVDNKTQEEFINNDKQELLGYLRKELSNYDIQLSILVITNDNDRKVYTPQDKFKKMAEKNPVLSKLRQQFDLDVDY